MGDEEATAVLAAKFAVTLPHLDERQRRRLTGAEARSPGHGGIRLVAGHAIQPGQHRLASLDDLYQLARPTGIIDQPEIKTAC